MEAYIKRPVKKEQIAVFVHPKERKEQEEQEEQEEEIKQVNLLVNAPIRCPFRYENVCTLIIEEQILKGCDVDFQRPVDCPLNLTDILVKADDNPKKHNSEAS